MLTYDEIKSLIELGRSFLASGEVLNAYKCLTKIDLSRESELTIEAGDPFKAIEERFKRYEDLYL